MCSVIEQYIGLIRGEVKCVIGITQGLRTLFRLVDKFSVVC